MELLVTVQMDGSDVVAGKLYQRVRHGVESASFAYDSAYLARSDAYPLAPDMPLVAGAVHAGNAAMFRAFEDCMPDRWGRNLMVRAERALARDECRTARTLFEGDLLIGVNDETRQGALRFWDAGVPLAPSESGVPREVSIPSLLASADVAAEDADADVRDLLAAGSSLGGARPKASIRDERGTLNIAKFPKADEGSMEDSGAWERTALLLAADAGIRVPPSRLIRVAGRSVLLVERFDRVDEVRLPYISGLTAVQGADGGSYSYLELVEFLEESGSQPDKDIRELWLRALFSCAIGNTDNHLRNYGFLREKEGWRLSPAFDMNPTPGDHAKRLSTALDFETWDALPEAAMAVSDFFRMNRDEAREAARAMARTMRRWRAAARSNGATEASIEHMASCFEAGRARLEKAAG